MSYLPETLPGPQPTLDDQTFWRSCAARRLVFQACAACGRFRHPPTPLCPYCQSSKVTWRNAPARGRIFTFTTVFHPAHPSVAASVPYNVSVIEFSECNGVRLVSNVVGDPSAVRIGAVVELIWDEVEGQGPLPRFRLVDDSRPSGGAGPSSIRRA